MTMKIPVLHDDRMNCDPGGISPSGNKPGMVVADWMDRGMAIWTHLPFTSATDGQLKHAHPWWYVEGVFNGRIDNGHGNNSTDVAEACRWTVGSMIAASEHALSKGVACSPSSGFHHAGYDWNHGFCTFNGLVIAAIEMIEEHSVGCVGILDFDFHQGDGTRDIINTVRNDDYWLEDRVSHVTQVGYDVLHHGEIERIICELGADLILYQAGADQHIDDPLGGLFNDDEMRERDRRVFEYCKREGIPIAWNLAGGYRKDANGGIGPVLETHRATMEECIKVYGNA